MKLRPAQLMKLQLLNNEYLEVSGSWSKYSYDFEAIISALQRLQKIKENAEEIIRKELALRQHQLDQKPVSCKPFVLFRQYSIRQYESSLIGLINNKIYGNASLQGLLKNENKLSYIDSISVSSDPVVYKIHFCHGAIIYCDSPNAENLHKLRLLFDIELSEAKRFNSCLTLAKAHL